MAKPKTRKWSNLKGVVPDKPQVTDERLQRVLKLRDERRGKDMDALAQEWNELEAADALAKFEQSKRNEKYDAIERLILDQIETVVKPAAGTDLWRSNSNQGTFSPKFTPIAVVTDKTALRKWIEDTNQEHLLEVPKGALNDLVREALDPALAATLTPDQRALLKPGDPSSGAPPPGVTVFLDQAVHHTGGPVVKPTGQDDSSDD